MGVRAVKVDTYSATPVAAQIFATVQLAAGTHTVSVTDTTAHNVASTGHSLSIDRADITPPANAILYGKTGTFGALGTALPTGESLATNPVTNWGFAPGDSEFFSALAPDGEVVLGTNPQTDDERYGTSDHMALGIFNPAKNTFRNLFVPTTTGMTTATNPFFVIGGASVDGLTPVTVGGVSRIAFLSLVPYAGWNLATVGEYPSLGYLDTTGGNITFNPTASVTASQIHAKGGLSAAACPTSVNNIYGQPTTWCRGLGELAVLPLSKRLLATQYVQDVYNLGQHSGRLIVMDPDGTVEASYTYPNIANPSGGFYSVNPREIDVDPTSSGSLEYFSVIFDIVDNGGQGVSPIQEFVYNRTTNVISPVSLPILSGQLSTSGKPYRMDTAHYDAKGNLWVTQAVTGELTGGPVVVYGKSGGKRKLETTCAAPAGWSGGSWNSTCAPDRTAANTGAYGQSRSFTEDPTTHTMFAATLSGYLLRIKQTGSGSSLTLTTLPTINLGLDQLVNRNTQAVGFRKGVVDNKNRALWLPVVQVDGPTTCPTWPATSPCTPVALDQWLYRIDLNALSS